MTGCILGFDYGARCIGVASGNVISRSARPLAALTARAARDVVSAGRDARGVTA